MTKQTLILILHLSGSLLIAQNTFSLEQAVKYGQENSKSLAIQKLDVQDAKDQVLEYYAIGMPKITGSLGYNYYINIPTNILPDFISPAIYGVLFKENVIPDRTIDFGSGFPAQFGLKNNLTAGLQLNALIFDGSFFVGLKAQKLYAELIQRQIHQSETDVRYQVTKAYLTALSVKENISVLDKNISNLEKVYQEMQQVFKVGFAEQLDVERIELSLQNLKAEKEKLQRLAEFTLNLLKFQMSYPLENELVQTQNIDEILNQSYAEVMDPSIKINASSRAEYQVIEQAKRLADINVRRYKASYFPSLTGFATHQEVLQRNNLFDSKENPWFPTSIVGLNLNVPIFDGFDRKAKIRRAKTVSNKTGMQLAEFERAVGLEYNNARTQYLNALNTLETRKKSLALADKIYRTSNIKFKEGIGSSLEITQSERDLYQAQANILDAQFQLIMAKVDLDKALGKI